MSEHRDLRYLYDKVVHESRRILAAWPAEKKSLSTLLREEKPIVRLTGGGRHLMDRDELRDFASKIPWFLHPLVKLPIVIVYRREGSTRIYELDGDVWAARALSALLTGRYWEEKWRLEHEEVEQLLKKYKTLIMVTIRVEISGLLEDLREV